MYEEGVVGGCQGEADRRRVPGVGVIDCHPNTAQVIFYKSNNPAI